MAGISPSIQTVIEHGNRLFSERTSLLSFWQETAEHFYYERADFTSQRNVGEDYASGTVTSVPALARREMGNLFRSMLRPADFFEIRAADDDLNDSDEAHAWLEYATNVQRATMYRRGANFVRSTVAGDHDYVTFGQCVLEVRPTPDRSNIFYHGWHLRDVAWSEDYAGNVAEVHRNCCPTLSQLVSLFGDKVPEKIQKDAIKTPHKRIKARHVVVPSDAYEMDIPVRKDHPWVSVWCIPDEGVILEKVSRSYRGYVVPRADTVSGSQYARSPFTSIILPDARTKAAIERILLESGEKALDPPMIAVQDAIRSDMGLYAGGVTWVDMDYDERLGDALRPISQDRSGLPFGEEMSMRYDRVIETGMMLNKINLPTEHGDKTAYEVRKLVEQQMRANIPVFEPVEVEYNEPLCAETFAVMRSLGAFPANEIPEILRSRDIEFSFVSPIKDLENDSKAQMFGEGMQIISAAAQLDPIVGKIPMARKIAKDTLRAIGWPKDWLEDDAKLDAAVEAMQQAAQQQAASQQAMEVAEGAGKAAPMVKALNEAQAA